MSTLRISNIEAKSVPASATIDEKVKITNSSGDPLVFIDGKTSGITTVGINTTDPNITFDANSNVVVTGIITATKFSGQFEPTSVGIADSIFHRGDTDTSINFPAVDTFTLDTAGSQRVRVDANGVVIVATGAARTYVDGAGNTQTPKVQIEDNSNSNTAIVLRYNSGAGSANRRSSFIFARTADGSAVSNNSVLGEVLFMGEGNNTLEKAASIRAEVDGTPGTTDMPGRLIFSTTADNANTTTERLRIKSDGAFSLTSENTTGWLLKAGQDTSSYSAIDGHFATTNRTLYLNQETTHRSFVVWNKNGSDGYGFGLDSSGNFKVVYSTNERLRITSSGGLIKYGNNINLNSAYIDFSGSISTPQTAASVFRPADNTLAFSTANNERIRVTNGGLDPSTDAVTDLGNSSKRYRDLYVSGGVVFDAVAGNATSNTLDDYEEGQHVTTVTMSGDTSFSYVSRTLSYTKIGRLVHVTGRIHLNNAGGSTFVFTLPFTCASGVQNETSNEFQNIRFNDGYTFRISPSTAEARIQSDGSNTGIGVGNPHLNVNLTYHAT